MNTKQKNKVTMQLNHKDGADWSSIEHMLEQLCEFGFLMEMVDTSKISEGWYKLGSG